MSNRDMMIEEEGCHVTMIRISKRVTRRMIHVAFLFTVS